jgi:hypothetical protein
MHLFLYSTNKTKKTFSRPAKMDHVESHLYREPGLTIACCHLVCKAARLVLKTVNEFKYHVKKVHGITLRDLWYVR